jgi:hypothetical protein
MRSIESPDDGVLKPSLFLAGGTTDCPNWQHELMDRLKTTPLILFNPRRAVVPMDDPLEGRKQLMWEYRHGRKATAIAFWFPQEVVCPLAFYALGAMSMTNKRLFVGVHPDYPHQQDVLTLTALARPDVSLVLSLEQLANQIIHWACGPRGMIRAENEGLSREDPGVQGD